MAFMLRLCPFLYVEEKCSQEKTPQQVKNLSFEHITSIVEWKPSTFFYQRTNIYKIKNLDEDDISSQLHPTDTQ